MDEIEVNLYVPQKNAPTKKEKLEAKKQSYEQRVQKKKDTKERFKAKLRQDDHHPVQDHYEEERDFQAENQPIQSKPKRIELPVPKEKPLPQIEEPTQQPEGEIFSAAKFSDLEFIHASIRRALNETGYMNLTRIQQEAIPVVHKGSNVIIKSETGSGKTLAYLVPLFSRIAESEVRVTREMGTKILIICPTRELSLQCVDAALKCGKRSPNVVVGALVGGENANHEKARLRKGVTILVGTPGRILYHIQNSSSFRYDNITTIVFEECDRILDMGFKKDIDQLINLLEQKIDINACQKLLVSAHVNQNISKIHGLNINPKDYVFLGFSDQYKLDSQRKYILNNKQQKDDCEWLGDGEDKWSIPKTLQQYYSLIPEQNKLSFLFAYANGYRDKKIIVFVSTCDEVELFSYLMLNIKFQDSEDRVLSQSIFKLHGNIDQKTRSKTYFDFKKSTSAVLISTSVASRGLDFPDVSNILLFDPCDSFDDYVNKVGRTARISRNGISLMVLFQSKESCNFVDEIQSHLQDQLKEQIYTDYFQQFQFQIFKDRNIKDQKPEAYLGYLIKTTINAEKEIYFMARRAYVSFIRAYGRLQKFNIKTINLHKLSKAFGLVKAISTETKDERYQKELMKVNREKFRAQGVYLNGDVWEEIRKKRRVVSAKELNKMEFM